MNPNPTQFVTLVNDLSKKAQDGLNAYRKLVELLGRVKRATDRSDPLTSPLTQAEVDHIISVQTQPYVDRLTEIETVGDALGTDPFH